MRSSGDSTGRSPLRETQNVYLRRDVGCATTATRTLQRGTAVKSFTMGLLSAAAVAATILLMRQQREADGNVRLVQTGNPPSTISLDRMREAGL